MNVCYKGLHTDYSCEIKFKFKLGSEQIVNRDQSFKLKHLGKRLNKDRQLSNSNSLQHHQSNDVK